MSNADIRLAEALREVGMDEASKLALQGHYSDFASPLDTPKISLTEVLYSRAEVEKFKGDFDRQQAILELRKRVMAGDFDG